MNPVNGTDAMKKQRLLRRLQSLDFALTEAVLYLDTHPDDSAALAYYNQTKTDAAGARSEYESLYGPITWPDAAKAGWQWVAGPWPWEMEV